MKRLLRAIYVSLTLVIFSLTGLAYTTSYTSTSYDQLPITPDTWQAVDLTYTNTIDGKPYPGEIKLLKPKTWLTKKKELQKEHHLCPLGNPIHLSIPEFGIHDICAKVTATAPITLDTSHIDWSNQHSRPVIGTFKRYASVVNVYTFKDRPGNVTKINATPNHPFYVKNKHTFIPIEDVSSTDQLVTEKGKTIQVICPKDKKIHCGKRYNTSNRPMPVYNLEVYRQHIYYVGQKKILVHNMYDMELDSLLDTLQQEERRTAAATTIQAAWRGYKERTYLVPGLKAMEKVEQDIKISSSPLYLSDAENSNYTINAYRDFEYSTILPPEEVFAKVDRVQASAMDPYDRFPAMLREGAGNCHEQACYFNALVAEHNINAHAFNPVGLNHAVSIMYSKGKLPIYLFDPWKGGEYQKINTLDMLWYNPLEWK